jgi:hypothetical protein
MNEIAFLRIFGEGVGGDLGVFRRCGGAAATILRERETIF